MSDMLSAQPINHPILAERVRDISDQKRGDHKAIPVDINSYLNDAQILALRSLEGFGWQLFFVRRPAKMLSSVVVTNARLNQYAVLEEDGSVNLKPSIPLRNSSCLPKN